MHLVQKIECKYALDRSFAYVATYSEFLMKYYFSLQYKMLARHLRAFGLHPVAGMVLAALVFIGLSFLLFSRTEYASFIYGFFGLIAVSRASEVRRNTVLKTCFTREGYKKLRLIENVIILLPFLIFLLFKKELLVAGVVLASTLLLSILRLDNRLTYSIPTPFWRRPFEFIVGFRTAYVVYFFAYFLTAMSIYVNNFNLGVFSLALVILTSMTFYGSAENKYFVWIFDRTPKEFLFEKMWTACWHLTILCAPVIIGLGCFYTERLWILMLILGLGFLYLVVMLLAKYSAYPDQMSLPQGILLSLGLWFPPLLLGIIPYFYRKSIEQLQPTLS